jgi:hypothetical protein
MSGRSRTLRSPGLTRRDLIGTANTAKVGNGGQTVLGRNAEDASYPGDEVRDQIDAVVEETGEAEQGSDHPDAPVMPAPPFPTFRNSPTLPHQVPGVGFESGRDSRAR